jgi:hypothetical protein
MHVLTLSYSRANRPSLCLQLSAPKNYEKQTAVFDKICRSLIVSLFLPSIESRSLARETQAPDHEFYRKQVIISLVRNLRSELYVISNLTLGILKLFRIAN